MIMTTQLPKFDDELPLRDWIFRKLLGRKIIKIGEGSSEPCHLSNLIDAPSSNLKPFGHYLLGSCRNTCRGGRVRGYRGYVVSAFGTFNRKLWMKRGRRQPWTTCRKRTSSIVLQAQKVNQRRTIMKQDAVTDIRCNSW